MCNKHLSCCSGAPDSKLHTSDTCMTDDGTSLNERSTIFELLSGGRSTIFSQVLNGKVLASAPVSIFIFILAPHTKISSNHTRRELPTFMVPMKNSSVTLSEGGLNSAPISWTCLPFLLLQFSQHIAKWFGPLHLQQERPNAGQSVAVFGPWWRPHLLHGLPATDLLAPPGVGLRYWECECFECALYNVHWTQILTQTGLCHNIQFGGFAWVACVVVLFWIMVSNQYNRQYLNSRNRYVLHL